MEKDISGIYLIKNTANGKTYVGSSIGIRERWRQHTKFLKRGDHHCKKLQAAWNEHDADAFEFSILEEVEDPTRERLLAVEQRYMDAFLPAYNTTLLAGSQPGIRHMEESRAKMRVAWKKHWDGTEAFAEREIKRIAALRSPEVVAKRSASLKLVVRTDEWRKAQSEAMKGNKNAQGLIGRKHSPEAIAKMKATKAGQGVGRKHTPEAIKRMKLSAQDRVARLGSPLANRPRDPVTGLILPKAKADAPAAEHTMFFGSSMVASDIADVIVAKAKELASEA